MLDKAYCRVAEAAKFLGVSQRTLWTWIHSGKIESYRIGGVRRIPRAAVLQRKRESDDAIC
jgi:excisionase family DNA binding protein